MNFKKLMLPCVLVVFILSACQKNIDESVNLQSANTYLTINKGMVTFSSVSNYLKVTENKNGEEQKAFQYLNENNFKALKYRQSSSHINNNNIVSTITDSFNVDLYSDYLLQLLNQDKIFSLNGFLVKVDMDNEFCSAIDSSVANAYNLLKTNAFLNNNTNVMLFTNVNEPVLEVLEKIRNNEITWNEYQIELSRSKGGQGICLKAGKQQEIVSKIYYNFIGGTLPGGYIVANGEYRAEFLSFRFRFESWVGNVVNVSTPVCGSSLRLNYIFQWAGVCKNGASGDMWMDNRGVECNKIGQTLYSGGSALKTANLTLKCYALKGAYSANLNNYLWNNVSYGNQPLKLGY